MNTAEIALHDDDDPGVRSSRPPVNPSQVYSIRVPVDRLEQVRRLASDRGVAPTAMLREWVLKRLDEELSLR